MRDETPSWLWGFASDVRKIPAADRRAFLDEAFFTLFVRSRIFAAFLLAVCAGLILFVDLMNIFRLDPSSLRLLLAIHGSLLAVSAAHLVLARVRFPRSPSDITGFHQTVAAAAGLFSLLLSDALFLMSLALSGSSGAYVIGVFCFATAFSLPGLPGLVLPASNAALFLAAAWHAVPRDRFGAHAAVVVIASAAAWIFSKVEIDSRVRNFLNARTIERQAVELRDANARLEAQNLDFVRLDRDKNEFLGLAVHNLQNPLSSILGYTEILLEGPEMAEKEREDILRRVAAASRRMIELIRNVLDLNAIARGEVPCVPAEVDFRDLAARAADCYRETARRKEQTIRLDGAPTPVTVWADPAMALQVLENLVSNASKFSPPGAEISIELSELPTVARCRVRDQGPGLTEVDRLHLFGTFSRLSARPTAGEPSTGLGLSIVRRLATALSARVYCEAVSGTGASFVFELPRSAASRPISGE